MKKSGKFKLAMALIISVQMMMTLISCSKENPNNLPVLHFNLLLSSNYSPILHLAANGGIAEKNGVYPILEYSTGIEPLLAGKVDGRLNSLQASIIAGGNGSDIVIFAGTMGGGQLIYANKNVAVSLNSPESWKGLTIGSSIGGTAECVSRSAFKEKFGFSDDDVKYKYYGGEEDSIGACRNGEVDVIIPYYAFREVAEAQGLVLVGELVDLYPDYACCRQTAYGPRLREDRTSFVNWTKGLIYSWKFFNENQKDTIKLIKKVTNQDEEWVYDHIYDSDGTAHITFNPDPFYNGCRPQYDVLINLGYIDKENARPFEDYFDISIYADALKEVISENPDDSFYKDMWTYFVEHNNQYPDFEKNYPVKL